MKTENKKTENKMNKEIIKKIEENIEYLKNNTPIEKWEKLQIPGQLFSLRMLKKELELEQKELELGLLKFIIKEIKGIGECTDIGMYH